MFLIWASINFSPSQSFW